jgi:hypothetical protein
MIINVYKLTLMLFTHEEHVLRSSYCQRRDIRSPSPPSWQTRSSDAEEKTQIILETPRFVEI